MLEPVAMRIIEGALSIAQETKVLIVSDAAHRLVAEVFSSSCEAEGATVQLLMLEDLAPRPHRVLHMNVLGTLARCEASIFIADFFDGESSMRRELLLVAQRYRVRHAHIIGVDVDTLIRGFQTDPRQIKRLGALLRSKLRGKHTISVTSQSGTNLQISFDHRYEWALHSGIITPGNWENLPSGELMTHPADISGRYVCDVGFSGAVGAKIGYLRGASVTFEIDHGRVKEVSSSLPAVAARVEEWMASGRNYDRVGVVSLGINVGITQPSGAIICDQNMPGLHISLGSTFPEETSAEWDTDGQMVFAGEKQDIDIDSTPIMRFGQYLQTI